MRVTGWTYFEDDNYIDILDEDFKLRCEYLDRNPYKLEDVSDFSDDEKIAEFMKNYRESLDSLFDQYFTENEDHVQMISDMRNVIIKELRDKNYHLTGDTHQNYDYGTPIIDNKYVYSVSMRTWGELMADAFPDEDYTGFEDNMRYIKWSWYREGTEEVLPKPEDYQEI